MRDAELHLGLQGAGVGLPAGPATEPERADRCSANCDSTSADHVERQPQWGTGHDLAREESVADEQAERLRLGWGGRRTGESSVVDNQLIQTDAPTCRRAWGGGSGSTEVGSPAGQGLAEIALAPR